MSTEAMKLALEAAYLAGFNASGEGYNSEYPFGDHARNPEEDAAWIKDRDNALRETLAEQPAPMIRGDIRDGLVDDEPAHQHIEHCLWARNGNQPCPHVQPAQQQEPVVFYRCNGCGHAYEQVHPTSCDCMEAGGFDRVEYYTSPPAQRKYCRGDRLICLETEEYCVIHISGTDRQWVKFPDTHIGVYKNEQLAELFELLPKEIEIEQPASKPWAGLTEEEIANMIREASKGSALRPMNAEPTSVRIARVVEAKLKEKNT